MSEVDLTHAIWRKSSYSSGEGQCVELAVVDGAVAMRDSKNPAGPALSFTLKDWAALEQGMPGGESARA